MDRDFKDVLLSVVRRLPDADKIKLLDIVPGIEENVKTFIIDSEQDDVEMGVGDLVKRLPNLTKVVRKTRTAGEKYHHDCQVLMALAEFNPRITEFVGFEKFAVLKYIKRVTELFPNYDAREVKKVFDYLPAMEPCFFKYHPDMKLKLYVCLSSCLEDTIVRNGREHLIHEIEFVHRYALRSELKSVRELIVRCPGTFRTDLGLLPNVEVVSIVGPIGSNDSSLLESLIGIKNLRKLHLGDFVGRTEANLNAFQQILAKPTLKEIVIKELDDPENDSELNLVNAFLDCERNDFRSLFINYSVVVQDGTITIYDVINFSLYTLYRKFKRINKIVIQTDNKFFEQHIIQGEINLIVETLPRNRSLCVQIGGVVTRY